MAAQMAQQPPPPANTAGGAQKRRPRSASRRQKKAQRCDSVASVARTTPCVPASLSVVHWPGVLKVGSICAGMLTDHLAKPLLNHRTEIAWWCEIDKTAGKFCRTTVPTATAYTDILSPDVILGAEPVDVISGGFPCQPFSTMGSHGGENDPRGVVVHAIILYMKRALPRVAILENVSGMLTRHADFFLKVVECIQAILEPGTGNRAYYTSFRSLNSKKFGGVPQDRERIYLVCIRRFGKKVPFQWPDPIECPSLSSIFDRSPKLASYCQYPMPQTKTAKNNIEVALRRMKKQSEMENRPMESYTCIVDTCSSNPGVCTNVLRTITRSRGYSLAYWSLQHGRFLTVAELLRLQGFVPAEVSWAGLSKNQMGALLGNAFTMTLYARVHNAAVAAAHAVA